MSRLWKLFAALLFGIAIVAVAGVTLQSPIHIVKGAAYGGLAVPTMETSITLTTTGSDTSAPFPLIYDLGDGHWAVPDCVLFVINYELVTTTDDSICLDLVKLETGSKHMRAGDTWKEVVSFVSSGDSSAVTQEMGRSYMTGMKQMVAQNALNERGRLVFSGIGGCDAILITFKVYPFDIAPSPREY